MKAVRAARSFTLVEILAAVAILLILFTILFGILQQVSQGWTAANRKVEASQVARLALEQMAAELQSCVAVAGPTILPGGATNYAFALVHTNIGSMVNPTWISGTPGMVLAAGNDYLYFVAPVRGSLTKPHGDLAEYGYIPVWNPTANTNTFRRGRYFLLRHYPFNYANTNPVADFFSNPGGWETTPSGTTQTNRLPLVDNCIRFDVQFRYAVTNALGQVVGISNSLTWGRPVITGTGNDAQITWQGNPPGASGLPLAADITLSVLDDRMAERLYQLRPAGLGTEVEKIPDNIDAIGGANAEAVKATLREGLTTFRRRVEFQHASRP